MRTRKLGTFRISATALRDPDGLQNLFVGMVIVDVRPSWLDDWTHYVAWHETFDPVPEGAVIPEYLPTYPQDGVTPSWHRR